MKWAVWVLVALVAVAFVVEGLTRMGVWHGHSTAWTYETNPDVMFFHAANSSATELSPSQEFPPVKLNYNRYGFRGTWDKLPAARPAVVMLGDEFVEARQVAESDTFVERLNRKIPENFYVNAGCAGYSTVHSLLLARERVAKLHPNRLVVFFSFDDYRDNAPFVKDPSILKTKPTPQVLASAELPMGRRRDWVARNVAFFSLFQSPTEKVTQAVSIPFKLDLSPLAANKADIFLDAKERELLQFSHETLKQFRNLGVLVTIVLVPLPMQVSKFEWREGKVSTLGYRPWDFESSRVYQKRLLDVCARERIDCVDLLPKFISAVDRGKIHYDRDGHWTPLGHELVAEALMR